MWRGAKRTTRLLGTLLPATFLALLAVQGGSAQAVITSAETGRTETISADEGPISLSTDGQTFTTDVDGAILIGIDRYVPGDRNQRTVWVRNDSGDPAWLWSKYSTTSADAGLLPFLSVSAAYGAEAAPAEVGRLVGPGQCTPLLPAQKIAAGQAVPMVIGASFAPGAPNETRLMSAKFAVKFGLTQDVGQAVGPNGCTAAGGSGGTGTPAANGQLPETGAGTLIPWLSLAAATALAGFVFVAATWKRRVLETDRSETEEPR